MKEAHSSQTVCPQVPASSVPSVSAASAGESQAKASEAEWWQSREPSEEPWHLFFPK